jgi:hypothetical protein
MPVFPPRPPYRPESQPLSGLVYVAGRAESPKSVLAPPRVSAAHLDLGSSTLTPGVFILALNIKGAVFPEGLDALSGYLPALIEINASAVHPQLQRLNQLD